MLIFILFTSPVLLIIVIGFLIRVRGNPERVGRRYFLFLAWSGIGSLAMILANWMLPFSVFGFGIVLIPIIPGLLVLFFLHLHEWHTLHSRAKTPILFTVGLLVILTIVQLWSVSLKGDDGQLEPIFFGMALLSITVFLFAVWKWGSRSPFLFSVFAILYLTFFHVLELGSLSLPSESMSGWLNALGALAYLAIPGIIIPVMVMLTNIFPISDETRPVTWRPILGRLMLFIILLGYLLYTYRWFWLWDGMDDGIRWIFMMMVSGIAAVSAGMVIAMSVSGWQRWTGLIFATLVIGSIYLAGVTNFGIEDGVTNYTVTEERAMRIQQAIESHHVKTGWYPLDLDELVPGELWRISLPMIMPGQGWCYQGGSNYYRLGAVYREHWSSPYLEVRVYASAGTIPEGAWECDERLAEAMSQSNIFGPPPTPVSQPTSVTSVQKVVVEPILQAESFSTGSWSLDGEYLVFGLTEYFMTDRVEHVTIDLRFLEASTGNICQPSQSKWTVQQSDGLRDHSAWLPDGRLLFVTDAGEMVASQPCVDGVEDLAGRYPVTFTHVVSSDARNGRVLLKTEDAYWLLNGISLEVRKIAGIPVESYRPLYSWSPDGTRLAISWMSGPEIENEAFLYIVDWASGEVEKSLPLEGASDASLPFVEWLTHDDLLLHGSKLTVMDFRSDPPAETDVLRDIFLLDIAYPNNISSMDSVHTDEGYYLGVQVNHPRNQDGYVYSSKTGQVEVFQQDVSTMIFFEDGQWMRLMKWEDEPSYRDEYLMVWMDRSNEETRLMVEGHVPRAHPQIFPKYLPSSSQLVISSSQGISLVSIPDGKTIGFWELASNADYFSVIPSPSGEALIIAADGDGLYYIPLNPK